jgi:hypothetical protein
MTPGSPEAVKSGCTCPIMDNNRGEGRREPRNPNDPDLTQFWVNGDCPIHAPSITRYSSVIIDSSGQYEGDPPLEL